MTDDKGEYSDIRGKLQREGYKLSDEDFAYCVSYARRKLKTAGKGEDYMPLLLPDVIKERFFRQYITISSIAGMLDGNIKSNL